ncbi:MAG: GMC family oxidoreductase N-terminal domain-containing protein, partial [Gemmatimonadaceae bacterium]
RLAEAGREVILLEEGEYVPPNELNENESELMPRLFADQCYRATDDAAVSVLQGATVGGGTTVNWMVMLRTPDHVLEEWGRRFGLTEFSAAKMAPIFARIEREVHARPVPDDAHSPANRVILDGANKLGWRASASLINAKGCVRAGSCSLGCRYEAKQGALQTYLPRAFAKGARLFANTGVSRVDVIERDSGTGAPPRKRVHATVRDPITRAPRASVTVDAPVVILAGGAVGTPSILQRSGFGGGAVGRFLRLHPTSVVFGVYNRELYPFAGTPLSATCDHFNAHDDRGYGFWIQIPGLQPALASAATPGFGAAHRERMKKIRNCAPLITLVRDGSDVERSSGSVTVDRSGRAKLSYRLSPRDAANMRAAIAAGARLHLANGALEIMTLHDTPIVIKTERDLDQLTRASMAPNDLSLFSAHVNGTCRMGTDASISGATPDGQRRGVRGLYVFDGSLLPTGLGVNPQETIMGVVTVLAERLAAH